MLDVFINLVEGFISMLKYPLILLFCLWLFFFLQVMIQVLIRSSKGDKLPSNKGYIIRQKKRSALLRLFVDAPKQYVNDLYNKKPGFFKPQGLIIYEGPQGSGKTCTMVHDAMELQKTYVNVKCISNLAFKNEDDRLEHWKKLIHYKNGIYGVIAMIDELQNWFNSNQSKNFPPEMLEVVTQNRKNRRVLMGTAQSFYMLAKNIRTQCTEVRTCVTFAGCVTFVRRKRPIIDSDGQVVEWKPKGMYFYVHTPELRNSYDTYKVIESLSKSGFKDDAADSETIVNNFIKIDKKQKK